MEDGATVLYEFYVCDKDGEEHFLGILPETRNDPKRITDESVLNLSKIVFGPNAEIQMESIRFVKGESVDDSDSEDNL